MDDAASTSGRLIVAFLAALVGAVTGALVAVVEYVALVALLDNLRSLPTLVVAAAPGMGLVLAALCLRFLARGAAAVTADAYIRNIHEENAGLELSVVPGRILGAIVTTGFGGAVGLEAVALYCGAAVGSVVQSAAGHLLHPSDAKALMVPGAVPA